MLIILCDKCHAAIQCNTSTTIYTLRSDYVPSDSEIAQIRTSIEEDEDTLKRCQAEINRLREVVETLKEKIRIEKRIQQQRASIHPIRRVPMELLEIIFSYDLNLRSTFKAGNGFLCTFLRYFYPTHHLTGGLLSVDGHKHDIRPLLKLYLSNSAGYPLKIEVKALRRCDGPEEALESMGEHGVDAFRLVFTDMAAQCAVLEFMSWYFFHSASIGHLSPIFTRLRYPQLHTVRPETPEDEDATELPANMVSEAVTWFWDAICLRAPNLTHLYAERMLVAHADPLPYPRLKSLLFAEVNDIARLLHVLENSSNLESLEVWCFQLDGDLEPHTMLSLSHLQTLNLSLEEDESLSSLSRLVDTHHASLELALNQSSRQRTGWFPAFMLSHSISSLQELRLDAVYRPLLESSLSSLVRALPNLTLLDVGFRALESPSGAGSPSLKDLFSKLTVRGPITGASFAPKLTTLLLHENCSRMNIDIVQDYLTLAESRSRDNLMVMRVQGVVSLSRIQVTYSYGVELTGAMFLPPDHDISHDPIAASRVKSLRNGGTICVFKEDRRR
ncbi:hypothetical protein WG66_006850 [Moniliophthora roreri]|nr:hypothetical protein WG66_006850 [Moniliophthora roreri]